MNKETAEQVANYMQAALDLDPENILIRKTNATRMNHCIGSIERRIARGDFPMLAKLREQFPQHAPMENNNESVSGSNT